MSYAMEIQTRWKDNDVYGHVNNVEYYSYFDTVINRFLIVEGGLDIHRGEVIGLCVASSCEFHGPLHYPEVVTASLTVAKLGRSSVTYGIGLAGEDGARAATGSFTHVFVGRDERRPVPIPDAVRAALERLA
jgi:acyl-CoA thioester hydrolase